MLTEISLRPHADAWLSIYSASSWRGWKCSALFSSKKTSSDKLCGDFRATFKAFASRNSKKRLSREGEMPQSGNFQINKVHNKCEELADISPVGDADKRNIDSKSFNCSLDAKSSIPSPSRSAVLQACTVTSGLILGLGAVVRQASHVAFAEGWVKLDSTTEVSFGFEMWHLELITGLVILISSCRYILLKTWPDFAVSSEAANRQVLSSLQPLDYVVVACLPGISEELLFHGGLLPLLGLNWMSAMAIGAVFGCLHLGSGRRYSFAVWATLVGFAYGMATIVSSSIIVPMASHSLNNLIGGVLWRCAASTSTEESKGTI